ncbi:MAG TPA: hypothetical protein VH184_23465 [Dongiaceae bacterium]|jgi:hypothetical protein|nr:hypothetical protein [Dongiaceae bacterium]
MNVETSAAGVTLRADTPAEHIQMVRVRTEAGNVELWIELSAKFAGGISEVMQFLRPHEAMALASALDACAIRALLEGQRA